MKWYKRDANESRKPHVIELYQRHGFKGIFFWDRLNDLLAEYFNFWCPGCYKFKTSIFYAFFQPQIKDARTIKKMLNFLTEERVVMGSVGKSNVYLYYPDIIERADAYTKRRVKDAEDRKQEQPESAREVAFWVHEFARFDAPDIKHYAKKVIENKSNKAKFVRTLMQTSSAHIASSSKGTNNNLDTKEDDKKGEIDKDHERFLSQVCKR